jgi:hypothetical protein
MMDRHQAPEELVGLELGFSFGKPVSTARSLIVSVLKPLLNFSAKNLEFLGKFSWFYCTTKKAEGTDQFRLF